MTRTRFLLQLASHGLTESERAAALSLAEEAGARFDPEPVELPVLRVWRHGSDWNIVADQSEGLSYKLTPEHAEEIVRRCNAWPDLMRLLEELPTIKGVRSSYTDAVYLSLDEVRSGLAKILGVT